MSIHKLKCDSGPYRDIFDGTKKCEVRKDDRGFKVGDLIDLYETENGCATGSHMVASIDHIQRGYGLPVDIAVLSISRFLYYDTDDSTATLF